MTAVFALKDVSEITPRTAISHSTRFYHGCRARTHATNQRRAGYLKPLTCERLATHFHVDLSTAETAVVEA